MAGAQDNDGNSPDDLPDLPEEWGVIVIPDDLSELSDEVEAVRAELRQSDRTDRWHRLFNRPGLRQLRRLTLALMRAPVLIISMAVLVTVASLFASAWPGQPRQPIVQRSATSPDGSGDPLPALELIGTDGRGFPLRSKLPAVILVIDGCDCAQLVTETTTAVPPDVALLVIAAATTAVASGSGLPSAEAAPQAQGKTVRLLHDSAGTVRTDLKITGPDGTAAALLVDRSGLILRRFARVTSVEAIRPDLARLS